MITEKQTTDEHSMTAYIMSFNYVRQNHILFRIKTKSHRLWSTDNFTEMAKPNSG